MSAETVTERELVGELKSRLAVSPFDPRLLRAADAILGTPRPDGTGHPADTVLDASSTAGQGVDR